MATPPLESIMSCLVEVLQFRGRDISDVEALERSPTDLVSKGVFRLQVFPV